MNEATTDYLALSASITAAFVENNKISPDQLSGLFAEVFDALKRAAQGPMQAAIEPARPAVSVKKSITPDYLICLEDGKKFKSLKRHLRTSYGMTPEDYRAKWNLPADYPMVAPNYAEARSRLAKEMLLGQSRRKHAAAAMKRGPKKVTGRRKAA